MRGSVVLLALAVLSSPMLAGCLGGDDGLSGGEKETAVKTAAEAAPTADTGSVKGKVLTMELDDVAGASIALILGADLVQDTKTATDGTYTFNGVAPGEYLVQVAAVCCEAAVKKVKVQAGQVTQADLQVVVIPVFEPYQESDDWTGFISCGASAVVYTVAVCSVPGSYVKELEDPNEDFAHSFNVSKGLHTLYIGFDWDTSANPAGDELLLITERCIPTGCGEYPRISGRPPLTLVLNDEVITQPTREFANITDDWIVRFRVFTPFGTPKVTYQQPFTVYYHEFYGAPPPDDFTPFPDS